MGGLAVFLCFREGACSVVTRIFASLAWFALVLMAATLVVGLSIGDFHEHHDETMRRWATVHRLSGVATGLIVVLVNSIVVTYFIGTSRWCKEVGETYGLERSFVQRANALKRRTFPWAVIGMLTVVGVIALGGAADPSTMLPNTEAWVTPHLLGALTGLAVIAWTFYVEWTNIDANHVVIADMLAEVRRIREERGLEV
jgi:amino acid transporter